jgi:hypothetical protein
MNDIFTWCAPKLLRAAADHLSLRRRNFAAQNTRRYGLDAAFGKLHRELKPDVRFVLCRRCCSAAEELPAARGMRIHISSQSPAADTPNMIFVVANLCI